MYEYVVTPQVSISFQRYPYPPSGFVSSLPRSRGALPIHALAPNHLILPCPAAEAFWIGFIHTDPALSAIVRVLVSLGSGDRVDALAGQSITSSPKAKRGELAVPPSLGVEGIARGDGTWWPFAYAAREATGTPASVSLDLEVGTGPVLARRRDAPSHATRQHDTTGGSQPPKETPAQPPDDPQPAHRLVGDYTSVHVEVRDQAAFEALTHRRLTPLSQQTAYGGGRLP